MYNAIVNAGCHYYLSWLVSAVDVCSWQQYNHQLIAAAAAVADELDDDDDDRRDANGDELTMLLLCLCLNSVMQWPAAWPRVAH